MKGNTTKLGWIEGVFIKCLLNIWGVMLFLRLTWVIGQAGLIEGILIITLCNVVTMITTISMSAISTNGSMKGGGIYFMISRSLGPEFGGAIGLMFTLANSIAVAMYVIGFCESLTDMLAQYLSSYNGVVDAANRVNDIRLLGSITLVFILILAVVGMSWVTRVEKALLGLLIVAQISFFIGSFLPPNDTQLSKGFTSYDGKVLEDNLYNDYTDDEGKKESFFTVFAVFFPAVTGIAAGANMSGDLKDPSAAIPKGTLLAIGFTYCTYILYGVIVAATSIRYASGIPEEAQNLNESMADILNITQAYDECEDRDCKFGTIPSQQMMETISAWGPLIYAGCFAATISSAIASLVGAPRVLQAVAKDKLFPKIEFFAKGYGPGNDPVRGYVLIFFISLICILIADLNVVSSLLSNFFVAAYALVNFSVFHASIMKSPGWRPGFKYYNKWVSLFGTVLCLAVMFLMDYITALITFIIMGTLYMWIYIRKPKVNWGSSSQAQSFMSALKAVHTLATVEDHVKTYRPKIIVFCGNPQDRPALVDFTSLLTRNISLLICANVVDSSIEFKEYSEKKKESQTWLKENNIKAFYSVIRNDDFGIGTREMLETTGLGKLKPNMAFFGFRRLQKDNLEAGEEFVNAIVATLEQHMSVGVLRVRERLDISHQFGKNNENVMSTIKRRQSNVIDWQDIHGLEDLQSGPEGNSDNTKMNKDIDKNSTSFFDKITGKAAKEKKTSFIMTDQYGNTIDENKIEHIVQFRSLQEFEGVIDVYWLFDDGGLTLLLPYILTTREKFTKCKLRVFFLPDKIDEVNAATRSMAELLAKFRIEFEDVIPLSDAALEPSMQTRDEFEKMITNEDGKLIVSEEELKENLSRITFSLRIAEIVKQNSKDAQLVTMTLPMLRKGGMPPLLYLACLDYTTQDMPPFMLVRGNQESVLTFYS